MSGTAFGTIVLHITPESAVGGPLALVKTGDMIRLDVAKRSIDLLVDAAELEKRRAALKLPNADWAKRGYAHLFHETILQADEGCDFDFMRAEGQMRQQGLSGPRVKPQSSPSVRLTSRQGRWDDPRKQSGRGRRWPILASYSLRSLLPFFSDGGG